jgi:proteasome lid subunit RPN8/RPN11
MATISTREQRFTAAPVAADAAGDTTLDYSQLQHRPLMELSAGRSTEFQIIFRQTTLDRIRATAAATADQEICGVLVGQIYADETGPFLLVENMVPMQAERGVGRAAFSQATWHSLQTHIAKEFTNRKIIGWYYTHPGQGPTMSALDRFLHDTFFSLPWQVALSHDPTSRQENVFSGYKGSVQKSQYLIEYDDPSKRMVDILAIGTPDKKQKPAKKKRSLIASLFVWTFRLIMGVIALGLFAVMGYFLGHLMNELRSTYLPRGFHF